MLLPNELKVAQLDYLEEQDTDTVVWVPPKKSLGIKVREDKIKQEN
jgi:hypothetical protein